jgi:fumarate reductase (CoM/CoB) subunit A
LESTSCDVLVIGSGAAGLRAAIAAREAGCEVIVVSKAKPGKATCTGLSAGVIAGSCDERSSAAHFRNTLASGRGLNQGELVETLVRDAPRRLGELMDWGIQGKMMAGYVFAQGRAPVMGEAIVHCLLKKSEELGARLVGGLVAADLAAEGGAWGANLLKPATGEWVSITAGAVVLASGGAGALYLRNNNPKRIVGDGWRLALEAGAVLQDLEFVQFFPLGLAEPGIRAMVVPPKLADRGLLVNKSGQDVLKKYGIEERPAGEKARDRLARALFTELYREGEIVYADLRSETDIWSPDPFSAAVRHILGERYGALERPMRVAPVAHHTMGGVCIDPAGATSVAGLFAAGEVTGGVHGANRLGGNALCDTLVFGAQAGTSAAQWAKNASRGGPALRDRLEAQRARWDARAVPPEDSLETLQKLMWEDGGVLRNRQGLVRARENIKEMMERVGGRDSGRAAPDPAKAVEFFSAAKAAGLIVDAALRREESRGSHFREDFPNQDDGNWRGHLQVQAAPDGEPAWNFRPEKEPPAKDA